VVLGGTDMSQKGRRELAFSALDVLAAALPLASLLAIAAGVAAMFQFRDSSVNANDRLFWGWQQTGGFYTLLITALAMTIVILRSHLSDDSPRWSNWTVFACRLVAAFFIVASIYAVWFVLAVSPSQRSQGVIFVNDWSERASELFRAAAAILLGTATLVVSRYRDVPNTEGAEVDAASFPTP
jgi:hypothetical protein